MRQVVLDTETTGLNPEEGHKIIEIGCIEILDRRVTGNHYHQYINPQRNIDEGAVKVHGITTNFLADKPVFSDIADEFIAFIEGAELIIHNAPFDIGFLNHELKALGHKHQKVEKICSIIDTLKMARHQHAGQRNSLDALCKRYEVDASQRDYHGALLDSELLAQVYLAMTGGQSSLFSADVAREKGDVKASVNRYERPNEYRIPVIQADDGELKAHEAYFE
ncbi:MAG: DNA polymerase III subunit epsilon [Gammaproteobacteria bacterium]